MTPADITLAMFTLCNGLRVVAYVPQITKAATDRGGIEAVARHRGGFARWRARHRSGACATRGKTQKFLVKKANDEPAGVERSASAVAPIGGWQRHVRPFPLQEDHHVGE